jgi:hypothetical protein
LGRGSSAFQTAQFDSFGELKAIERPIFHSLFENNPGSEFEVEINNSKVKVYPVNDPSIGKPQVDYIH